jgi:hypothetical protein
MIDSGDDVIKAELQIREQQIILGNGWERFKVTYEVVAEVPDGPAPKRRQARNRFDRRASE